MFCSVATRGRCEFGGPGGGGGAFCQRPRQRPELLLLSSMVLGSYCQACAVLHPLAPGAASAMLSSLSSTTQ